jgi:hypothetical protein
MYDQALTRSRRCHASAIFLHFILHSIPSPQFSSFLIAFSISSLFDRECINAYDVISSCHAYVRYCAAPSAHDQPSSSSSSSSPPLFQPLSVQSQPRSAGACPLGLTLFRRLASVSAFSHPESISFILIAWSMFVTVRCFFVNVNVSRGFQFHSLRAGLRFQLIHVFHLPRGTGVHFRLQLPS